MMKERGRLNNTDEIGHGNCLLLPPCCWTPADIKAHACFPCSEGMHRSPHLQYDQEGIRRLKPIFECICKTIS